MHAGSRVYKGQITFLFYTKILRQKNEKQDYARLLAANDCKIAEWPMPSLYNLWARAHCSGFPGGIIFRHEKDGP